MSSDEVNDELKEGGSAWCVDRLDPDASGEYHLVCEGFQI